MPTKVGVTAWSTLKRLRDILSSTRADLVYVLREAYPVGPPVIESAMQRACGRLAFDFDDAIWLRAKNFDNPLDSLRDWSRPAKIIKMARRIIVGSEFLAQYAREHAIDPKRVVVLPSVVDTNVFRPALRSDDGTIIIGWIGTPRNTSYIWHIWPALVEAARREPRIRYVFVGASRFETGNAPVEFRTWTLESEVADVQGFDIGIMPLPNDEQARGKCGFKLVQYMSCGIPAVASPVGANRHVLIHEKTGLLADTQDEWCAALVYLARNRAARRELGAEGRARAEEYFSLEVAAPRFVSNIEAAACGT
jgi:glycosyltransferase involved in cell wall biosynthesis